MVQESILRPCRCLDAGGAKPAAGRSRQQVRDEDEKRAGSDDLKHVLKFYDDGMKEIWNM